MRRSRPFAARIARALDPLRARLRRDEIRGVAGRLALAPDASRMAFALALLDQAEAAAAERASRRGELDRLADALATHGAAAARVLLADHLRRRGAPRAVVRALDRHLDADGVAEREARALGRLDGTRELCLVAAGKLAAEALVAARLDGAEGHPAPLAPEAAIPARLAAHAADGDAPWTVRAAALDAMRALAAVMPWPLPPRPLALLDRLAGDGAEHRWVQVAALRALGAAAPARARARARALLLHPVPASGDGNGAVVRARAARILVEELGDPGAAAALRVAAADDSEHVRQSVARACGASGDAACVELLAGLSDPAVEASPRVRAVAAMVHAAQAAEAGAAEQRIDAARALARVLLWDPDLLPAAVAADAAAERCADAGVDPEVRGILETALAQARARADVAPAAANLFARAAERARAAGDPLRPALLAAAARLPEAGSARVPLDAGIPDDEVGRALAELAQDDFGLYARRDGDAVVLQRGDRVGRRAWRVLHELRSPLPSKRQGQLHTVGRVLDAPLRAHPGGLAEVAPTRVPGERVYVAHEGGWGSYLPLVDDFLSAAGAARLYSEHGCTAIQPPQGAARLAAQAALTTRYAELAALRLRSLEAHDDSGRGAYIAALRDLGFAIRFEPWPDAGVPAHVSALYARRRRLPLPAGDSLQPASLFALAPLAGLDGVARALGEPAGAGPGELLLFTGAAAALLAARALAIRLDIAHSRRAIPLVVGGWGTRGKSGVERLKAALFHALGYEVVSKTTGCEATLLVGVPGRPLTEVPLYRPYEKATIWEQRDVLRFAGVRRPHALLWECMALNPGYVDLLQRGWMRDDISTLTNAYPDHEDVQGPSGLDVARVIAGFTPARARLVTAEEQMLPVIRERARAEGTALRAVGRWAHELLPEDLLARFPYREHPRNLALVMALAEELGVDPELALVEMADHVVPDIGGLRSYGPLPVAGRRLRFTNAMSANERASARGSWQQMGFDRHRVDEEPGRWVVAFVNNRADRPVRTMVFAEALVDDFAAHRVVLAGSNVAGLRRALEEALDARLARLSATQVPGLLAQLKIGAATPAAARAELEAWLWGLDAGDAAASIGEDPELGRALAEAFAAPAAGTLAGAARGVDASGAPSRLAALLAPFARGAELLAHARASWIRRRAGAGALAEPGSAAAAAALRELFLERLVEPADPLGAADTLVEAVAAACPPGTAVEVMGLQNIKGAGMALVHAFAAGERALADAALMAGDDPEERDAALRRLKDLDGVGALVLEVAAARAEELGLRRAGDERARLQLLAARLRARAALARTAGPRASGAAARLWAGLRRSLDHVASSRRRRRADAIFAALATGRMGCTRAARELARLTEEQRT